MRAFLGLCCAILLLLHGADAGGRPSGPLSPPHRPPLSVLGSLKLRALESADAASPPNYKWDTRYYEQTLDHFTLGPQADMKWKQRYLVNDESWDRATPGPIFFYTGNEGDIEWFARASGFMWDLAPAAGALLVFAEHRFYGASQPFGPGVFHPPVDVAKLGLLSASQAIADFAELITHLRAVIPGAAGSPVVAFGGSYGGMLAAWLRTKYPHLVAGAHAASAPIAQFGGLTPAGAFNDIVTAVFAAARAGCESTVRSTWTLVDHLASNATGRAELIATLRVCGPLDEHTAADAIKGWLYNIYGNIAMANYPYAADFLEPLPANPVAAYCAALDGTGTLLSRLGAAVQVYFNSTGGAIGTCFPVDQQASSALGDSGWTYQACTEMIMPMSADGVADMFWPMPWDEANYVAACRALFPGAAVRPNAASREWGGRSLAAASNIAFTNGLLDPWHGGSLLVSPSPHLVVINISAGAHHLDLRAATPRDPPSVRRARAVVQSQLGAWIDEARSGTYPGGDPAGGGGGGGAPGPRPGGECAHQAEADAAQVRHIHRQQLMLTAIGATVGGAVVGGALVWLGVRLYVVYVAWARAGGFQRGGYKVLAGSA